MRPIETLLSKRWILKSREKELYYQMKDEVGKIKGFLTEKLGYPVIVNPHLIKIEKIPASPENWMGIQEFTDKIEYVLKAEKVRMFTVDAFEIGDTVYDDESSKAIGVITNVDYESFLTRRGAANGRLFFILLKILLT